MPKNKKDLIINGMKIETYPDTQTPDQKMHDEVDAVLLLSLIHDDTKVLKKTLQNMHTLFSSSVVPFVTDDEWEKKIKKIERVFAQASVWEEEFLELYQIQRDKVQKEITKMHRKATALSIKNKKVDGIKAGQTFVMSGGQGVGKSEFDINKHNAKVAQDTVARVMHSNGQAGSEEYKAAQRETNRAHSALVGVARGYQKSVDDAPVLTVKAAKDRLKKHLRENGVEPKASGKAKAKGATSGNKTK